MKVLVCLDGSFGSKNSLVLAQQMFGDDESNEIILFCVTEEFHPCDIVGTLGAPFFINEDIVAQLRKEHQALEKSDKEALVIFSRKLDGIKAKVTALWAEGEPREVIVKEAERLKVQLIIMGSRGLGIVQRLLLGSVSDYVVHNAKCSVLISK